MADLPIDIHPEAQIEQDATFDWYHCRSHDSADAFVREIEMARSAIQKSPAAWAKYMYGTRRYLLKRFPIAVVYRLKRRSIEIVAIAHGNRKPGYWVDRLSPSE